MSENAASGSVSDPHSLNPDPDPSYFITLSEKTEITS